MNKLTFKRVWSPNRGDDGTDNSKNATFVQEPEVSALLRKCHAANRWTLLRAAAICQKLVNILFPPSVLFRDKGAAYETYTAKICCDSRSRVRTYCARIVMAIRYSLFVQKLFRACRPEKEPIYLRQICVRPRWWRCDLPRYVATVAGTLINIGFRCFPLEIKRVCAQDISATRIVLFCFFFNMMAFRSAFLR